MSVPIGTQLSDGRFLLPASVGQERLWFLSELDASKARAYHLTTVLDCRGPFDRAAFQRGLNAVVARHETLRCGLRWSDDRLFLAVAPELPLTVPVVDAGGDVDRLIGLEAAKPFDLEYGPLLRVLLVRHAPEHHELVVIMHHLAADNWSLGLLVRELVTAYTALVAGTALELPELEVQYADYAAWQREQLASADAKSQLNYWQHRLEGLPALDLAPGRRRPAMQTGEGANLTVHLDADLVRGLRRVARDNDATLFMVLAAGFAALLHRYSGQEDFGIGVPVANRPLEAVEPLIGFFANTLVLRTDFSGEPTFTGLLQRVREDTFDALSNQDAPFEQVVDACEPERDLSRNPLFQVLLTLGDEQAASFSAGGLDISLREIDTGTSLVDLALFLAPEGDALRGRIEYDNDLFDGQFASGFARHLTHLLEDVVTQPGAPVADLRMLAADEEAELVGRLGRGADLAPPAGTVADRIAAQAVATPGAIAVRDASTALTYAELIERADGLAGALQEGGVRPGDVVSLAISRTAQMLVGVLGVLRAGAAYLPLDASHPAERLAVITEDAGARTLVTERALAPAVPAHERTFLMEDAAATGGARQDVAAGELAYVIYTSGSTGRPKGVEVPHRALANTVASIEAVPGVGPGDVMAATTTLAFDIAATELFNPLCVGGQVFVIDREATMDGERLACTVAESGATMMQGTPASWRLLAAAGFQAPDGFRAITAGEALPVDLARDLLDAGCDLWNLYGPTETTIYATTQRITRELVAGDTDVPIGRPVHNTTAYVVDRRGRLLPRGAVGELHLGGAGVANGYRGRPDLTAERFVLDPFVGSGARMYRTGDLARWRADGALDYLGRNDAQVKIRGFRVELAEIEIALVAHPAVAHAVATVKGTAPNARLVAFVVASEDADLGEIRRSLRQRLPEYMVPAVVEHIARLPVSPNGKVDRRALPAVDRSARDAHTPYVAPRTPTEREVAEVVAAALGIDRVSVDDDFFEIGGHSLLAAKVVKEIGARLGVKVPLQDLFHAATVANLAAVAESREVVTGAMPSIADELADRLSDAELESLLHDPLTVNNEKES